MFAIFAALAVGLGISHSVVAHEFANGTAVRASCFAFGDDIRPLDSARHAVEWTCDPIGHGSADRTINARFDAADLAAAGNPTHLVSYIGRFETLSMNVVRGDISTTVASYTLDDVDMLVNGPNFALPLPDLSGADAFVVTVTKPWNKALASDAHLETMGPGGAASLGESSTYMLIMAMFCGLMLCPLIYNLAFYRVLQKEFLLWHCAAILAMMLYVKTASGMDNLLIPINIRFLLYLYPFSFLMAACLGTYFAAKFLEAGALSDRMQKALIYAACGTFGVLGLVLVPVPVFRTFSVTFYSLGFLPLLIVYVLAMAQAARRGSRAVKFQIAGWVPLLMVGLMRIANGIGLFEPPNIADELFFLTIAFQVVVTSLGVVDRFYILRRDHDRATARLEMLSGLVDRDALTGIYNRRALEQKFAELREEGFTAMAVLDLDYFKRINDQYGHTAGDRVLQEVSTALDSDDDALPFRMGGEEFVLLVRGANLQDRCERIRTAIPIRVANQLPDIKVPVTASLGLVDTPPGATTTMRKLYAHADRLLYEAKNKGRNRMISERIRSLEPARRIPDRRDPAETHGRRVDDHLA